MAELTMYGLTADDTVFSGPHATYATARAGTGLALEGVANASASVGQYLTAGSYYCYELSWGFDDGGQLAGATISAATLYGTPQSITGATAYDIEARVKDWGAAVDTTDWVAGADLGSLTLLASKAAASLVAETEFAFTDAALAANIVKGGVTRMILCSSRHRIGNAPAAEEYTALYTGNQGGVKRPRLVVTYTLPSGSARRIFVGMGIRL